MQRFIPARFAVFLVLMLACGLASWAAAIDADKAFEVAKHLYDLRLGSETRTVTELNKFITGYPKDVRVSEVKVMLARVYQRQQQYAKAITLYQQIITSAQRPEDTGLRAECHYQTADCYWMLKQYDKAIKYYNFSLALSGTDTDLAVRAHYWQAECLYQLQRFDDAARQYGAVQQIDPKHALAPWAVYSIGMIELQRKHYDEAIAALEQVTTHYDKSEVAGEATLMLGFAYSRRAQNLPDDAKKQADFHQAIDLFTAVIGSEKATPTAKQHAALALAETYFMLKDYPRANDTYLEALKGMEPGSQIAMDTQLRRGHALYDSERYGDAAAAYAMVAASRYQQLAIVAQFWLGNSWYQVAGKEKNAKAYIDAITAFRRYLTTAGDKAADAPRAALLLAFCLEDQAAAGDADAGTKALLAFHDICTKWPTSREAVHAQDGIARMTASMPVQELRKVVDKLPEGATWSVDLSLARKEFQDGKYDQAVTDAKKVLDANPGGAVKMQAAYIIGACLQQTTHPADAVPYYRQALDAVPTGELAPYALRGLILAYMDLQHPADARDAAMTLTKLPLGKEESAQALLYLGNAYTANQQLAEASDAYQRISTDYADSTTAPLAYMGLAAVAEAKKDAAEAIARYREVIRRYPDHDVAGQAFYRIGIKQTDLKQFDEAIEAFKNVPATHSLADKAAYAIAWAYSDEGKTDEANKEFVAVADTFPTSSLAADSLTRVGEYWMEKQQYAQAKGFFNRAFQIVKPGTLAPLVAYKLGVSAFYAKDYPVAVIAFDKVVTDYSTNQFAMESLFMKARSLDLQNQLAPAREVYQLFLTKYPKQNLSLDAALGAGRCGLATKQYAQARTDLAKAQVIYDDLRKAHLLEPERANAVRTEVQYYQAESYYQENNYQEAFMQYAAVPDGIDPWSARALLQMARCSGQLGNLQDAHDTLQSLITRYPESDAAKQAPMVAKDLGLDLTPPKDK